MKKFALVVVAMVFATTLFAQGTCPGATFAEHGIMRAGVEGGCWVFVSDSGVTYQPVGGPGSMYREGLTGTLYGKVDPGVMTICMQGPVVATCGFDADNAQTFVGTLSYSSVEGGCWVLKVGNRTYLPLSEARAFYMDGAKLKVTAVERFDIKTLCMVGGVIEVLSFTVLGNGKNDAEAEASANCQSNYAHCVKVCRDNYCFVSCETVLASCEGR